MMGILPVVMVTTAIWILMKGYTLFTPDDVNGEKWPIFHDTFRHYKDKQIDPSLFNTTRQGRIGFSFLAISIVSILEGSRILIPRRESKREEEILMSRERKAYKKSTWALIEWKRSNFVLTSILMSFFLVVIVEWSLWGSFGKYIWEAIIFLKILNIIMGEIVGRQLGENLLTSPVMAAFGLIQNIVTLSANDFMDFLLSYVVGFGFLIIVRSRAFINFLQNNFTQFRTNNFSLEFQQERMYIGPFMSDIVDWSHGKMTKTIQILKHGIYRISAAIRRKEEDISHSTKAKSESDSKNIFGLKPDTVEPIIDSYGGTCLDTLGLLYVPFIIVVLMLFRDESELPSLYGIKEKDMEHYFTFALVIVPFQILTDIVLHGSLELFHGKARKFCNVQKCTCPHHTRRHIYIYDYQTGLIISLLGFDFIFTLTLHLLYYS